MNKVVEIIMKRDNIDEDVAIAMVKETRDELLSLDFNNMMDYDDIIWDYLGLEPDYLEDILDI